MTRPSNRFGSRVRLTASGAIQPARSGAGSGSASGAAVYAIHAPSGDHTGGPATPSIRYASPPGNATRANHVALASSPASAGRLEAQGPAVGRPARPARFARRIGEPEGLALGAAAAELLHPDLAVPAVLGLDDGGDGEDDEAAVGRDRHLADADLRVVVRREQAPRLGRGRVGGADAAQGDDAEKGEPEHVGGGPDDRPVRHGVLQGKPV